MELIEVDPFDDDAYARWHAAYRDGELAGRERIATAWAADELLAGLRADQHYVRRRIYAGLEDGEVVVTGQLDLPLKDNTDSAHLHVTTPSAHQRRGHAKELVARLEEIVRGEGRSMLMGECGWAYDAPADGRGTAQGEFARSTGFKLGVSDVQRELALPVDPDRLTDLAAEAAQRHRGYRLESWVGPVPDECAQGFMDLSASLITEAPTGDIPWEQETTDVAVLREREATIAAQGRTKVNTLAFDAAGEAVAYTDLGVSRYEDGRAYQWGTLVRPADRGHRLGLAVKVANLQLLAREHPDLTRITTFNAEVNDHMISVNEALGYRPIGRGGEFHKLSR